MQTIIMMSSLTNDLSFIAAIWVATLTATFNYSTENEILDRTTKQTNHTTEFLPAVIN